LAARALLRPFIAFALTVTLFVGCGSDDDSSTADEYLLELQSAFDRADVRFQPLTETINQDFGSESEEITAWREFFAADLEILNDLLDEIRNLNPPGELEDEHQQLVEGGDELVQAISETRDDIGDVTSKAELEELLESPALDERTNRFDSACIQLQQAADSRGIEVDLDCE